MKLIGMLDSPYVRRTAISLRYLGIAFEHQALSVFSTFEEFQKINPVVKAPSLLFDNGDVLMDSSLILEFAEYIAVGDKSLMPFDTAERRRALCIIGMALAACEKAVQTVYERNLRPPQHQYQPWLARINGQLLAACAALEKEISQQSPVLTKEEMSQVGITVAVVWQFIQSMLPEIVDVNSFPALQQLSEGAERLPIFLAFPPVGPGV